MTSAEMIAFDDWFETLVIDELRKVELKASEIELESLESL